MNHVHHGSVLVIVLLLLAFFTLWASTVWRETSSMIDVAHKKQQYEQQFRLTEALLEYGIAAAKIIYKKWCNDFSSNHSATCVFDLWPPLVQSESSKLDSYSGKITIMQHEKKITIQTQLFKKESIVCAVHAVLSEPQQENGASENTHDVPMLVVTEWNINVRS